MRTNIAMAKRSTQYGLLLKRELLSIVRDSRTLMLRLMLVIGFAAVTAGVYNNVDRDFQQRKNCFVMMALIPMFTGMVSLLVVFPQQKMLFLREYSSNTYETLAWVFSFMIVELPREMLHMLLFCCITYFICGFDGAFWEYWVTLFLAVYAGGSFGQLIGVVCDTTDQAAQMVPAALIPLLMFGDAIVGISSLPEPVQVLKAADSL